MTIVLFASLVWQVVDFVRELFDLPGSKSSVVTQATAWLAGIVLVALAAHAQVTAALVLPGLSVPLGGLDAASVVLVGMLAASLGSSLVDVKQAIDGNDSARKPPLIGP